MEMTWEEAKLAFPILRDRAIRAQTCFCKCGCRAEDVPPASLFGNVVPGVCTKCDRSRSWQLHERASSAAYILYDAEDAKAPKSAPSPVTEAERREAVAYVTGYGEDGTPLVDRLRKRIIETGEALTDAEVRSARRSKGADVRYAERVIERVERRRKRDKAPKRLSIPKSVPAGYYALSDGATGWVMLRLDRPPRGVRRGWVVVFASADAHLVEVGAQPAIGWVNALTGTMPEYKGKVPRAIALLISNPTKAAADYKQLMKETE